MATAVNHSGGESVPASPLQGPEGTRAAFEEANRIL